MSSKTLTESVKKHSHGKRILLAEDDDAMRRFIEIILKQAGYEVVAVEDGLAAMQSALENDYDALVTDAVMPNFTGYDLCRALRSNSAGNKFPCIILSGLKIDETNSESEKIADISLIKDSNLKQNLISSLTDLLDSQN